MPMKSLFQFHFVCKSWCSLLSIPRISVHINHVSDKNYSLMRNIDVSCPSDVICKFKIPIELQFPDFMLLELVNGILCICGPLLSHVSYVYLWNPLTHEFKPLPKSSVHMGYVAFSFGFGFGFVPYSNDYKVVRVLKHERKSDYRTEIYSLNRNSWKEITGNERDVSVSRSSRYRAGALTVDLEKEVITKADYSEYDKRYPRHRSPVVFAFAGSLVSFNKDHDDLG